MTKQKEMFEDSKDTDKLLTIKKNLKEKEYRIYIYKPLKKICLGLTLFVALCILYIYTANYKDMHTAEIHMPMSEAQFMPETKTFVDLDILNKINNFLKNVKEYSLKWDKKNKTYMDDVLRVSDANNHPNFLKKLIKIFLNKKKHTTTEESNKHKQLQDNLRNLEDSKNISDLNFIATISSSENSVERTNDAHLTNNFQAPHKISRFHRTSFDEDLISHEKHVDDLFKDDGDSYYDDSNEYDDHGFDSYASDEHDKFSSERFHPDVFAKESIVPGKHASDDLLKDDGNSYYDDSNDYDDDYDFDSYASDEHDKFSSEHFHPDFFAKELIVPGKHASDDLLKDDGNSYYDDSNDYDDDYDFDSYASDEHDKFSSEHFHPDFFAKELIVPGKHANDDLLKDDGDSYYDDSNDYDNDYDFDSYASDGHDKFSSKRFHPDVFAKELIVPRKHASDDLLKHDGNSYYDDSNDYDDDYDFDSYASDEHDKFSSEHFHPDFFAKELIVPGKHTSDDLLKDDGDSHYDDSNNYDDDYGSGSYASDEHDKFSSERFHPDFFAKELIVLGKHAASDDLLKDDGDSHYDDSNYYDNDYGFDSYASDEHDKFSSEHFHPDFFAKELIVPGKHTSDDLLKDDGDSHYDDSNDYDDDYGFGSYASDEHDKFSSERFHPDFLAKELIVLGKHAASDDLLKDDGDSHSDDSNDYDDDYDFDSYTSGEHDIFR